MRLTILKSQAPLAPQTSSFSVRVGALTLTPAEQAWWHRYGAEPLEALLSPYGGITAVQTPPGITAAFASVTAAREFVQKIHAACMDTQAYWQNADAFHGNDDYELP